MNGAGLTKEEQRWLLRVCSAVLAIGNVDFTPGPDSVALLNAHRAEVAANLLGVDPAELFKKLAYRTVTARGESAQVANSVIEARTSRDTLASLIYQQMFVWLTERLNRGLRANDAANMANCSSIGVLDLYGFEKLQRPLSNGFDQLVVNYADEKVHNLSTQFFARAEQKLYRPFFKEKT